MQADKLDIQVLESRQEMGTQAAHTVADKIIELQQTKDYLNILFASAPSQNEFLDVLKQQNGIAWERINAFHMDEYVGVAQDAAESFGHFLKVRLFDHKPLRSVHYLNGSAQDVDAECARYSQLLLDYPIDIVCLGIGENGHLAFNDPHVAFFNDPLIVKQVELDQACRQQQVNDGCFPDFDSVPKAALTLTIPTLMKAAFVFCMVPGEKKAQAVYNTINEDIDPQFPSTIMRQHPHAVLFIDKASASLLEVGKIAKPLL